MLGTDVLSLAPGRYLIDGLTIQANDMHLPVPAWHYEIVVYASENKIGLTQNYKAIKVYPSNTGAEYTNQMNYDGNWTGWVKTATATKPDEHDLPLAAGVSATIAEPTYFKTQDGVVVVTLDINANEQIAKGTTKVVANLPAGYRPTRKISVCVLTHYAGVDGVALATVSPNGAVSCASAANSWQHFYGQVSFVAT